MYNENMMTFKSLLVSSLTLSVGAIVLNIGRLGLDKHIPYAWLNWNLFLALIPLFFAWTFTRTKNIYLKLLYFLLWIGFLPNAPYIVTDFIHLADVGPKSILWYDAIMIFLYTLSGIIVWVGSTYLIKRNMKFNEWFILFIGALSGFGLYLGRYIRFNTWDFLTNPLDVFSIIGEIFIYPSRHEPIVLMTLVTTFIFFLFFKLLSYNEKTND